ncbi:hypothetical protein ACN2AU_09895 [Aerococcus viridans]
MKISKGTKLFILNFLMFLLCIASTTIIITNNSYDGYELLFTQPLFYSIVFIIFLNKIITTRNTLFYLVFTAATFIRYVLLPVMIVLTSYYGGRSPIIPKSESFTSAIILMNLELLVVSIFILKDIKKNKVRDNTELKLNEMNSIDGYIIFIFITILLMMFFPKSLSQVNFIMPSSLNADFQETGLVNFVTYCIIVAKQLLFIIFLKHFFKKYSKKQSEFWIFLSVLFSLLNISIYFGANRMDIVINAFVSTLVLNKLYGRAMYKYIVFIAPLVGILFSVVTEGRGYSSVTGNSSSLINFADILQTYTGGVYNVAIAVETPEFYPNVKSTSVFLMDIFRSMIGPNILLKNINIPTSNVFFNRRLRPNSEIVSQILPMVGQGYIFFGFFFSSILTVTFLNIQFKLEKVLNRTNSLEIFYFVGLSSARFGMLMGNNSMILINDLSMNLFLFLLVYIFNKYFTFKK